MSLLNDFDYLIGKIRHCGVKLENIKSNGLNFSRSVEKNTLYYDKHFYTEERLSPVINYTEEFKILNRQEIIENKTPIEEDFINAAQEEDEESAKSVSNDTDLNLHLSLQKSECITLATHSNLSKLFQQKGQHINPFEKQYRIFGVSKNEGITLKIWLAFANPEESRYRSISICVNKSATVENVIGYILYRCVEEGKVSLPSKSVGSYSLRITEDDGTADEDFPALDKNRNIQKFSFDAFALCVDRMDDIEQGQEKRKQYIKVHVYSTLEVRQTTTITVTDEMTFQQVLNVVCKKRKVSPDDYTLKMSDTKTDVPLHKTAGQLNVTELYLLRKDRGISAGDIFLRPPDEIIDLSLKSNQTLRTGEYASNYKQFVVFKRVPMTFGTKHEKILAIDGDYLHLINSESKYFFETNRTVL
ncbi:SIN1-domain-containing protein, partial [Rozella allomycis CSF55]